ncbi:Oligopeptide transport system permease protein OppB [Clostridiaceae bacterium JG1575]|nr:Oligopeptide transport system permease protein OppB [Clostridiaceae bacterium JG1575]
MAKYVLKRLIYIVLVFVALSIIIFFMYSAAPGDPARNEVFPLKGTLSNEAYEAMYQQVRARMGLDDPLPVRYWKWFRSLITLDLGVSTLYNKKVMDVIRVPLKNTVQMNLFVVFFGLLITIPLGIAMAVKRNTIFDRVIQVLTLVGVSIPSFVTALILIYFFAVKLRWFPVSGWQTPDLQNATPWMITKDRLWHMVLPVAILVLSSMASTTRYIRSAMVSALSMDYIKTARAKGLSEKAVIFSHAWRNALLPVVTLLIGWILSIFYGSIVVETMFGLNGMGNTFITALRNQDWAVGLGVQMFYVLLALASNLIIDLSFGIIDPRVRVNA